MTALCTAEVQQLGRQFRALRQDHDEGEGHYPEPEWLGQHLDADSPRGR
ncbi:hypothetical protein [Massilia oculi]|nr:hypothetical protein [Massilia oculi]